MTLTDQDWQPRLALFVDQLAGGGALSSPAWRTAFDAVPRHVFVPTVLTDDLAGPTTVSGHDPARRQAWLDLVYTDTSLVTQYLEHPSIRTVADRPLLVPTSSSTMPSLIATMLQALDVADGQRILEIGTGTGYNAALLCHRLGSGSVVSLDIDPALVAAAEDHLGSLGYHPTLLAGDGAAEHGPYDRIIATAAVPDVPLAWIEQLAPGGKILANVRGELAGGTLCLLTKDCHDEVIGPILPLGGHFMWLRPDVDSPLHTLAPAWVRSFRDTARTSTVLDPAPLIEDDSFRFLLQLHLRGARGFRRTNAYDPRTRATCHGFAVETADGSHAEVIAEPDSDGRYPVIQAGPRRLWDNVEAAHQLWQHLGQPDPSRFGVVANPTTQFVWHDTDDGWYRWPLPLV